MRTCITLGLILLTYLSYSQVKSNDLVGMWTTCNDDSLYYKADTVIFYQDINQRTHQVKPCCYEVNWKVTSHKKLKVQNLFSCTEPGRVQTIDGKGTFKILGKEDQTIVLKRNGKTIDEFTLLDFQVLYVERYPHEIKIMKLARKNRA